MHTTVAERPPSIISSASSLVSRPQSGKTGSIPELYRHYGIDANAIVAAAAALTPGRPIRHLRALG